MNRFLKELNEMDQLAQFKLNYEKTLALLRAMKAGEVDIDQVTMLDDGWQIGNALPPLDLSVEQPADCPVPVEPPTEPEEAAE